MKKLLLLTIVILVAPSIAEAGRWRGLICSSIAIKRNRYVVEQVEVEAVVPKQIEMVLPVPNQIKETPKAATSSCENEQCRKNLLTRPKLFPLLQRNN
jgi:hypothetical protein